MQCALRIYCRIGKFKMHYAFMLGTQNKTIMVKYKLLKNILYVMSYDLCYKLYWLIFIHKSLSIKKFFSFSLLFFVYVRIVYNIYYIIIGTYRWFTTNVFFNYDKYLFGMFKNIKKYCVYRYFSFFITFSNYY